MNLFATVIQQKERLYGDSSSMDFIISTSELKMQDIVILNSL